MPEGTESAQNQAYAEAGVFLDGERVASGIMGGFAEGTHQYPVGEMADSVQKLSYGGVGMMLEMMGADPKYRLVSSMDGAGNKPRIAALVGKFDTLGHDLVAMNNDDLAIIGAIPWFMLDMLTIQSADFEYHKYFEQYGEGLQKAAWLGRVAIVGGENAQHSHLDKGDGRFYSELAGATVGILNTEKELTGEEIQPGHVLVGIRQKRGIRCNGNSRIIKTYERLHGEKWYEQPFEDMTLGEAALEPSTIYSPFLNDGIGGLDGEFQMPIVGAANITGNGISLKLGKLLAINRLGAYITEPGEPSSITKHCQENTVVGEEERPMTDEEFYTTFNGGPGMIVVAKESAPVIELAKEHGHEAYEMGPVTDQDRQIYIKSRGTNTPGKRLHFDMRDKIK